MEAERRRSSRESPAAEAAASRDGIARNQHHAQAKSNRKAACTLSTDHRTHHFVRYPEASPAD
jgi:hypothetical protein